MLAAREKISPSSAFGPLIGRLAPILIVSWAEALPAAPNNMSEPAIAAAIRELSIQGPPVCRAPEPAHDLSCLVPAYDPTNAIACPWALADIGPALKATPADGTRRSAAGMLSNHTRPTRAHDHPPAPRRPARPRSLHRRG